MATLFTNVGCPVEVTGHLAFDQVVHVKLPFNDVYAHITENTDEYIEMLVDVDTVEVPLKLYKKQSYCPEHKPGHTTPGEVMRG